MDNITVKNYNEYLRSVIEEQSKRVAELEYLLTPKPSDQFLVKHYLNRLEREFFGTSPKKLQLLPKSHKLKLNKSKQDRLTLIKQRTNTTKKLKLTKHFNSEKFWLLKCIIITILHLMMISKNI